ncbi:MAG: M20/M25/M40 family metallo-hydrolase [Planctomycetota bacterium]|nr:MAG: M20/M25/M40 family metallo-hydrolase [Planctomycetota bacterium]
MRLTLLADLIPAGPILAAALLAACAQHPAAPEDGPATAAIAADELAGHVGWLASDELEGRRSGSGMDLVAADYLAARLAAAGLEPAGENGGWFQDFPIDLEPEPGDCLLRWSGGSWTDVGTVQASADGAVRGELVAVGYGLVLESHDQDDFRDHDAAGGIALIRRYTMFGPNADPQFAALGNLRRKIKNAAAAGAVGVVLGTHPDDVAQGGDPVIDFEDVPGTMPIPVVTVSPEQFAALEAACGGIGGRLGGVGIRAEVRRGRSVARNVLGLLPGARDEVVVVGAHYDHLGWGGQGSLAPGVHAIHNGADDNASGTALTLELAEALALGGERPERGVLFALWAAEEEGLYGSKYWVEHPTLPLDRVVANVNLDMVGRLQEGRITVGSAATAAAFGPALAAARRVLAERGSDLVIEEVGSESPGGGGSDHMSFQAEKIPALFFFSGLHADYHKPSDDADKLDYPRLADLGEAVAALVRAVAASDSGSLAWVEPAPDPHAEQREVTMARVWFGSIPDYGANPEGGGMQIAGTSPGGPAEKAGLKKGDIIKKVGQFEIVDIYDFMDALGSFSNGDTVDVVVVRDGKELTLPLTFFPRSAGD